MKVKKIINEHPYDKARRQWSEILAGKKTYWKCLEEILKLGGKE